LAAAHGPLTGSCGRMKMKDDSESCLKLNQSCISITISFSDH
jgi:hypothetical protein